jgi:hypothetical protein
MEKLIFKYLNCMYPKTYRKLTKFGYELCGYNETNTDWIYVRGNMTKSIMALFCCNWITADDTINKWIDNLRVVDGISDLSNLERAAILTRYNITL